MKAYMYGSDLLKSMSALNQRKYSIFKYSMAIKYFQKHQSTVIRPARDDIKYFV